MKRLLPIFIEGGTPGAIFGAPKLLGGGAGAPKFPPIPEGGGIPPGGPPIGGPPGPMPIPIPLGGGIIPLGGGPILLGGGIIDGAAATAGVATPPAVEKNVTAGFPGIAEAGAPPTGGPGGAKLPAGGPPAGAPGGLKAGKDEAGAAGAPGGLNVVEGAPYEVAGAFPPGGPYPPPIAGGTKPPTEGMLPGGGSPPAGAELGG